MAENEYRIDEVNQGLKIYQRHDGFSYGTDAVLLAAYIRKGKGKAVEFGSGTGIVSLLCEQRGKYKDIYSVEVQDEYFELTKKNISINNSSVKAVHADIRQIDVSYFGDEVDCVFSNPPYMKTESGKSNTDAGKNTARHEVKGNIEDFCFAANKILKTGGAFYVVYRPDRLTDLLNALNKNNFEVKRMTFVHSDSYSRASVVLLEAKKQAKSGLLLTKPLLIYKDNTREYTEDMKKIYRESEFDDEFKRVCYRKKQS